jgi:hypothetical protein
MKFILEPDGDGEPTIWVLENGDTDNYRYDALIARNDSATHERYWPDIVARMTGTTITNDVDRAALARAARDAYIHSPGKTAGGTAWDRVVDAILAALTGVPHD